mgnify:FL=1
MVIKNLRKPQSRTFGWEIVFGLSMFVTMIILYSV